MRKLAGECLSAIHHGFTPDVFLHSMSWWHPWSATLAPPRRACDGHLHAQLIAEVNCRPKCVFPFGCHICEAFRDNLRRLQGGVEVLEAGDPDSVHPLQVELDAFLADISVHPVPPDARVRRGWGILEALFQRIGRSLCC